MRGTERNPVYTTGKVEALELDCDISEALINPPDQITLKIILNGRISFMEEEKSYYMKFLLYDFDRSIHLFLFDAKVLKMNKIPSNTKIRFRLFIISPGCKLIEYV
jgi:hypothetical protein